MLPQKVMKSQKKAIGEDKRSEEIQNRKILTKMAIVTPYLSIIKQEWL
jgi:hypothetical protein